MKKTILSILIVLTLVFSGCFMMDRNPMMNTSDSFMNIYPQNDYTDFSVDDKIKIEFAADVDKLIAESNITLIDMKTGQEGELKPELLSSMMKNRDFRNSVKNRNSVKCGFHWCKESRELELTPNDELETGKDYCIIIDSEMVHHMNKKMSFQGMSNNYMGMSNCNCMKNNKNTDFLVVTFKTR